MGAITRYRSSAALLGHVLDQPGLVKAVQHLPVSALARLVDQVGLEDAGELLSMASTEQVSRLLDEDLWREGDFDAARFLVWLEVMLEAGEAFTAQRLSELDEDLLCLAVHQLALVVELEALAAWVQEGGRQADKALESALSEELLGYQVIARQPDGWDTLLTALLALDRDHSGLLERVLARCSHLASEQLEDSGGLSELLSAEESLAEDASANRDERRMAQGFVSPTDAAAFLAGARRDGAAGGRDHVAAQYLRAAALIPAAPPAPAEAQRLLQLLGDAEVLEPEQPLALPSGEGPGTPAFVTAMRALREFPPLFSQRMAELTWLCNVLVAAESKEGRSLRPIEALQKVIDACSKGLDRDGRSLADLPADHFFKVGWQETGLR